MRLVALSSLSMALLTVMSTGGGVNAAETGVGAAPIAGAEIIFDGSRAMLDD
jgi:hypothetical protein